MKTLHICNLDKFIPPFIEFIRNNFESENHLFILIGDRQKFPFKEGADTLYRKRVIGGLYEIIINMHKAEKIVLHSLLNFRIVQLLFFMPWLLRKCYWIMWGADLYCYQIGKRDLKWKVKEFFRRPVIRNIGNLVTGTIGDYEIAVKWYNANGEHIRCFNYPSNLYKDIKLSAKPHEGINIQVGNSAEPTNKHFEIFNILEEYKKENIKIFCPLSYGNPEYARMVIAKGEEIFRGKFIAMVDFMPIEKYLEHLSKIDIAIFSHERQQAMGNAISLLGMGKKVFLNNKSTLWRVFEEYGIKVYNIDDFDLSLIEENAKCSNIQHVKDGFSKNSLIKSLKNWIE